MNSFLTEVFGIWKISIEGKKNLDDQTFYNIIIYISILANEN